MNKPISIKDAIPSKDQTCVFYGPHGALYLGKLANPVYGEDYVMVTPSHKRACVKATHWVPVPILPEEANE